MKMESEITFELKEGQFADSCYQGIEVGKERSGQIIGQSNNFCAQKSGEKNKAIKKICLNEYVFAGEIIAIKTVDWCGRSWLTQMIVDCGIPIRFDVYVSYDLPDFRKKHYNKNDKIYVFGEDVENGEPMPRCYKEGDFIVGVIALECLMSYDYPSYIWQHVEGNITKIGVLNMSAENFGKVTNTEVLKSTDYEIVNRVFITTNIKKSLPCWISNSASGYDAVEKK